jgi:hypothetical protein
MREINITQEYKALVDDDDYEYLNQWKWHYSTGHAYRRLNKNKLIGMHRVVVCPNGFEVDHINHNKLDNRQCNLRICTQADNNKNTSIRKSPKTFIYKGVRWWHSTLRWNYDHSANICTLAWGTVSDFATYMIDNGYCSISDIMYADLGDVVQFNNGTEWHHSVIITKVDADGNLYYSAHSDYQKNASLADAIIRTGEQIRFFHVCYHALKKI